MSLSTGSSAAGEDVRPELAAEGSFFALLAGKEEAGNLAVAAVSSPIEPAVTQEIARARMISSHRADKDGTGSGGPRSSESGSIGSGTPRPSPFGAGALKGPSPIPGTGTGTMPSMTPARERERDTTGHARSAFVASLQQQRASTVSRTPDDMRRRPLSPLRASEPQARAQSQSQSQGQTQTQTQTPSRILDSGTRNEFSRFDSMIAGFRDSSNGGRRMSLANGSNEAEARAFEDSEVRRADARGLSLLSGERGSSLSSGERGSSLSSGERGSSLLNGESASQASNFNSVAQNGVDLGPLERMISGHLTALSTTLRNDLQNLHVELIKQSLAQQSALRSLFEAYLPMTRELMEALTAARDENERLRLKLEELHRK